MFKDPLLNWPDGPFPYDALAEVGITPASDMRAVDDALFGLIGQGLITPESRAAWEELRVTESRLWVDLFLYPVAHEQVLEVLCGLAEVGAADEDDFGAGRLLTRVAEVLSGGGGREPGEGSDDG
jgi:hypothetical protein